MTPVRAVYFTSDMAIDESNRVSRLVVCKDDGSGDVSQGFDSIDRLADGQLRCRRGDRTVMLWAPSYAYEVDLERATPRVVDAISEAALGNQDLSGENLFANVLPKRKGRKDPAKG